MKDTDRVPAQAGDADGLCSQIRRESEEEARRLVAAARRQAEELLAKAQEEARAIGQRLRAGAVARAEKAKERILASAGLDTRRAVLEERMVFVNAVLDGVSRAVEAFRFSPDYRRFLIESIKRAVPLVGQPAEIVTSRADDAVIDGPFRAEASEVCRQAGVSETAFCRGEFQDAGLIVRSADGRIVCDCRISSLLAAERDAIVGELLKGDL